MFMITNLIYAIATILDYVLVVLNWLIIIRALLSWVNPDPFNPIVKMIHTLTEPVLRPLRRIMPPYSIGIDLSPIIALVAVWFLRLFLVKTLFGIAMRLS